MKKKTLSAVVQSHHQLYIVHIHSPWTNKIRTDNWKQTSCTTTNNEVYNRPGRLNVPYYSTNQVKNNKVVKRHLHCDHFLFKWSNGIFTVTIFFCFEQSFFSDSPLSQPIFTNYKSSNISMPLTRSHFKSFHHK